MLQPRGESSCLLALSSPWFLTSLPGPVYSNHCFETRSALTSCKRPAQTFSSSRPLYPSKTVTAERDENFVVLFHQGLSWGLALRGFYGGLPFLGFEIRLRGSINDGRDVM
jgi:hypothetical protein